MSVCYTDITITMVKTSTEKYYDHFCNQHLLDSLKNRPVNFVLAWYETVTRSSQLAAQKHTRRYTIKDLQVVSTKHKFHKHISTVRYAPGEICHVIDMASFL